MCYEIYVCEKRAIESTIGLIKVRMHNMIFLLKTDELCYLTERSWLKINPCPSAIYSLDT